MGNVKQQIRGQDQKINALNRELGAMSQRIDYNTSRLTREFAPKASLDMLNDKINMVTRVLDRKVSRVQRLVAQLRFSECKILWDKNLLIVREEDLDDYPTAILERFNAYLKAQEITPAPTGDWNILVV